MITVKRFTASWCAPCKMLAPVLKTLESAYPSVTFEVIDIDDNELLAEQYNIRSVPTVIIFNGETPIETIVGVRPKQFYIDKLESLA